MKLYRNVIILIAVLVLLGGAYFFVSNQKVTNSAPEASTEESLKILIQDYEKVNQLSVKNTDGEILLKKEAEKWVLKSPVDLKSSPDQVSDLASALTVTFTANKLVEEKAADLKQYGLNQPYAELSLTYADNKVQTLEVGDKTPTDDAYYILDKDSGKIYTVSTYTTEKILNARKEVLETKLFSFKSEEVKALTLEKGGKLVFTSNKKSDTEWEMTAPIPAKGNVDKMKSMADSLLALTVSKYIEENAADLGKYGLRAPLYSLELETAKGKNKVFIGDKVEGSSLNYAKMADSNAVFSVDTSALAFLDTPLKELIDGFAYLVSINDVSKIEVEMDGKTNVFTLQTDGKDNDKDKFFMNGKDATMKDKEKNQYFRNYYQQLIGISLDDIDLGAAPSSKPDVAITYTLKKAPGTVKVALIPKDSYYYYIMRDGKYTNMIVAKSKLDEPGGLREALKLMEEAVNKQ